MNEPFFFFFFVFFCQEEPNQNFDYFTKVQKKVSLAIFIGFKLRQILKLVQKRDQLKFLFCNGPATRA